MPLNVARTRNHLAAFDFKTLFIEELGWNRHDARLEITVDGQTFALDAVAEKRGLAAFVFKADGNGLFPTYPVRRKIERQVTKSYHEHLIIFTDGKQSTQVWQWVRREPAKPAACREYTYHAGQPGDALIQKLQALAVSLEEEESLTLFDVTSRTKKAFDVERVTKRFYDRFKIEHAAFLQFLEGIPDAAMERWYVSVMLNRLMFIYFIQKKGFLDGDTAYLKNGLARCRKEFGPDHFYRDFLCHLFFEGFAKRKEERPATARSLLGEVPYLNGGIFLPHQIEQLYGRTIAIPDKAFENLFVFFDDYHWHLDERPLKEDNEINPDVLGYIFEKYINQKQMGAYYTKEDITEYIGKNTIVPFIVDAAREKCKVAFEGARSVWNLLQEEPDRYIYPAVAHGIVWEARETPPRCLDQPLTLPPEIEVGLDTSRPGLLERRKPWNKPAPPEYALPTEIWREVVARRKRYDEVEGKLAAGEIRSINDLITYNLDIRQFAQDVIENCEGPELLLAFWKVIEKITVLDPTCGSGAFLFAALNILEPLYDACLERMRFFLEEWGDDGKKNHPNYHKLFSATLKRLEEHPNHRYFILKSIIINNLYGVDIMEEAVEICKLRLFLKLVAQIDNLQDIEPLPDIDFNIRAGNTLVGFVSRAEVRHAAELENAAKTAIPQQKLMFGETVDALQRIEEEAEIADRAFRKFREMQTEQGMSPQDFTEAKANLRTRLRKLTDELDRYLASEYRIDRGNIPNKNKYEEAFAKWHKSHQPFHWFAEFYGILKAGGFDVIIGNPPYVVYSSSKVDYHIRDSQFVTFESKNLYAYVFERALTLVKPMGQVGFIVQLTALSAEKMDTLQQLLTNRGRLIALSFPRRPTSMFDGVEMPVSILLSAPLPMGIVTTKVNRCYTEERPFAFDTLYLQEHTVKLGDHRIAKFGIIEEANIFEKISSQSYTLGSLAKKISDHIFYYQEACRYWSKACQGYPYFKRNGAAIHPPHGRIIPFGDDKTSAFAACLVNSSLFFWYYTSFSDCEHINDSLIRQFKISKDWGIEDWAAIWGRLEKELIAHSERKVISTKEGHRIEYQEMDASLTKPIIDEIDSVLAKHYGFTEEEFDFIINYDIKYRMGQNSQENDE